MKLAFTQECLTKSLTVKFIKNTHKKLPSTTSNLPRGFLNSSLLFFQPRCLAQTECLSNSCSLLESPWNRLRHVIQKSFQIAPCTGWCLEVREVVKDCEPFRLCFRHLTSKSDSRVQLVPDEGRYMEVVSMLPQLLEPILGLLKRFSVLEIEHNDASVSITIIIRDDGLKALLSGCVVQHEFHGFSFLCDCWIAEQFHADRRILHFEGIKA